MFFRGLLLLEFTVLLSLKEVYWSSTVPFTAHEQQGMFIVLKMREIKIANVT